jgi:hypothetical protein
VPAIAVGLASRRESIHPFMPCSRLQRDTASMTNRTQPMSVARTRLFSHPAARRRDPVTRDDLLGLLFFPLHLVVAIAGIVFWIVAALIRGGDEG